MGQADSRASGGDFADKFFGLNARNIFEICDWVLGAIT
jgi:hypothetical protein